MEGIDELLDDGDATITNSLHEEDEDDEENQQTHRQEERKNGRQRDLVNLGPMDIMLECFELVRNHKIFWSIIRGLLLYSLVIYHCFFAFIYLLNSELRVFDLEGRKSSVSLVLAVSAIKYGLLLLITILVVPPSSSRITFAVGCIFSHMSITSDDVRSAGNRSWSHVLGTMRVDLLALLSVLIFGISEFFQHEGRLDRRASTPYAILPFTLFMVALGLSIAWVVLRFRLQLATSVATLDENGGWSFACGKAWKLLEGRIWEALWLQSILFCILLIPNFILLPWCVSNIVGPELQHVYLGLFSPKLFWFVPWWAILMTLYSLAAAVLYASCKASHGEKIIDSNHFPAHLYEILSPSQEPTCKGTKVRKKLRLRHES